jgi:hypothetical protein
MRTIISNHTPYGFDIYMFDSSNLHVYSRLLTVPAGGEGVFVLNPNATYCEFCVIPSDERERPKWDLPLEDFQEWRRVGIWVTDTPDSIRWEGMEIRGQKIKEQKVSFSHPTFTNTDVKLATVIMILLHRAYCNCASP